MLICGQFWGIYERRIQIGVNHIHPQNVSLVGLFVPFLWLILFLGTSEYGFRLLNILHRSERRILNSGEQKLRKEE